MSSSLRCVRFSLVAPGMWGLRFPTRDPTQVPYIARQILAMKVPVSMF